MLMWMVAVDQYPDGTTFLPVIGFDKDTALTVDAAGKVVLARSVAGFRAVMLIDPERNTRDHFTKN